MKDVPNGQLRHIRLENNENKPVTNSRDTQEVPPEKGKQVLKIIHTYKHQESRSVPFSHVLFHPFDNVSSFDKLPSEIQRPLGLRYHN